jgi:hypothetical protein
VQLARAREAAPARGRARGAERSARRALESKSSSGAPECPQVAEGWCCSPFNQTT